MFCLFFCFVVGVGGSSLLSLEAGGLLEGGTQFGLLFGVAGGGLDGFQGLFVELHGGSGGCGGGPEEIQAIVENIQSTPMKRDKISVNYSGFSFRMNFYGENGRVLDSFVVNSTDTIRSDPFFYCCDGGLCYDYLGELEAQYVN